MHKVYGPLHWQYLALILLAPPYLVMEYLNDWTIKSIAVHYLTNC